MMALRPPRSRHEGTPATTSGVPSSFLPSLLPVLGPQLGVDEELVGRWSRLLQAAAAP